MHHQSTKRTIDLTYTLRLNCISFTRQRIIHLTSEINIVGSVPSVHLRKRANSDRLIPGSSCPSIPRSIDSIDSIPWAWPSLHSVPCATTGRESHSTSLFQDMAWYHLRVWLVCRFFISFFLSFFLPKYYVVHTCFFLFHSTIGCVNAWMQITQRRVQGEQGSADATGHHNHVPFRRSWAPNALALLT